MGQAKLRGSFEQRQTEGIARLSREADEREHRAARVRQQESERRAALYHSDRIEYEREKRDRSRVGETVAMLAGMLAGMHADPFSKLRR